MPIILDKLLHFWPSFAPPPLAASRAAGRYFLQLEEGEDEERLKIFVTPSDLIVNDCVGQWDGGPRLFLIEIKLSSSQRFGIHYKIPMISLCI